MKSVREIIDSLDGDELCRYCQHSPQCDRGVRPSGNGEPIFPPCADGLDERDFDLDAYLADLEDGNET